MDTRVRGYDEKKNAFAGMTKKECVRGYGDEDMKNLSQGAITQPVRFASHRFFTEGEY
jgi:hypothetical protein